MTDFERQVAAHVNVGLDDMPQPPDDAPVEVVAQWLQWKLAADIQRMLAKPPTEPEYGPDGRSLNCTPGGFLGRNRPTPICEWCNADRYDRRSGRCARCNEPYYDSTLYWPGKTSATVPAYRLTWCEPYPERSVAVRLARGGGRLAADLVVDTPADTTVGFVLAAMVYDNDVEEDE